ncbi:hypothetical protein [Algoriphagus chordae]|uniref:Uncharacterized protein n=1 Tax=Algoriphagus chordae TaxID=237019 RepID=A0A2W7QTI1_9BACT|nr:hypothetical protein [Algoriphagus chordae]PZX51903.1 hypothetical protein LV85_02052 [Algoriphagus chordae]
MNNSPPILSLLMYNKIRSAITGYKVKKVSVNGLIIKTSYNGKMPSSDPLTALKEVKVKLDNFPNAVSLDLDLNELWGKRLSYLKDISSSSSSKFEINKNQYKIERFVTKQDKAPLSLYTFSRNDKIFALFSRVYDYGNYFNEVENCLVDKHIIERSESGANMHFVTNGEYSVIVDVFGHSQSFFWNDKEELEMCLETIL